MNLPQEIIDLFEEDDVDYIIRKRSGLYEYVKIYPDFEDAVQIDEFPDTAVIKQVIVITDKLNIRENPSTSSSIVGSLTRNNIVSVVDRLIDGVWYELSQGGFIASSWNNVPYVKDYVKPEVSAPSKLTGDYSISLVNGTYRIVSTNDSRPTLWVNIREFAYPLAPDYPYYTEEHQRGMCAELNRIGIKGVRLFTPHKKLTVSENIKYIENALKILKEYNLKAMIVLSDSIGVTNFAMNQEYHTYSDLGHLNLNWYTNKVWRSDLMEWIKVVVPKFANHPALFGWQIMNEPTINQGEAPTSAMALLFTEFIDDCSDKIFELDNKHPISIGLINSSAIKPKGADDSWFREWIGARKNIHIVNVHSYQYRDRLEDQDYWEHEAQGMRDLDDAQVTGRAGMVDEYGSRYNAKNRTNSTDRFLQRAYIGYGGSASICAQWAFMWSKSHQDFGVGDGLYGWDDSLKETKYTYEELKELYIHWTVTNLSRQV